MNFTQRKLIMVVATGLPHCQS